MITPADPGRSATAVIRRDAAVGAVANGVINAGIGAWLLRGSPTHLLSVDSIASREHTVLGSAVTLALSLGLVVGCLTFVTFRRKATSLGLGDPALLARPFLTFGLPNAVAAALGSAAMVTLLAVLWQRFAGTVSVSTPVAALLSGLVAAATAWHVASRASRALLNPY